MKESGSDELFAVIAHQWREPLTQINSVVSKIDNRLYELGMEDQELQSYLTKIEKITHHMSHSIDDFRAYYKKDTTTDTSSKIELKELLDEVMLLNKESFEELGLLYSIDTPQKLSFDGDATLLKQIFITLVNNTKDAFVARNIYQPKIDIIAKENEASLFIECRDNAGGMSKSTIEKLFEADFTTKHMSEGTGMGLFMVKKLLREQFNGDISVKNFEKGASFMITIPLEGKDKR